MRSPSCGYASSALDADFARLVSLACHDLRTPLATVQGFAKTMVRLEDLEEEKLKRYLGLIDSASDELAVLLELLSLAARIEGGRYEPVTREADSLALAPAGRDRHRRDRDRRSRCGRALARGAQSAAARHGGAEVERHRRRPAVCSSPSSRARLRSSSARSRRISARRSPYALRALGGEVALDGERLTVSLPTAAAATSAGP